ncbi:MAG TPA: peptidylprolyl isomerase [Candidatus Krumholzibacteria bacterium]|nr:peptidylprolyl isomerase [Candidatus Krumholzibacteria bacterium]
MIRKADVRSFLAVSALAALLAGASVSAAAAAEPEFVRFETEAGTILLVMYPELAPHHVGNFTHLARTGFFDGTVFHRIIPGFVIQGGDPNSKDQDPRNDGMGGPKLGDILDADELAQVQKVNDMLKAKGYKGVGDEANLMAEFSPTAKHLRGTLSMARAQDIDSAGSQFFICVAATPQLDRQYTVFGHVVMGMEAADTIVNAEKNPAAGRDYPAVPVHITKATVIEGTAGLTDDEKAAWAALPADLKNAK